MNLRLLGFTALAVCLAAPAYAQVSPSATASEIIVTARKRQESILNVPVIETALPQEQLERLQTRNLQDLSRMVPGLTFGRSNGTGGLQLSIRGIGTTTSDPAIEQTVALNIDGVQMYQGLAFLTGTFDVGQIEVLKGPQSLFYGKSAPGGVIAIRTADPTSKFEVIGRAMYEAEAREKRGELIVSGPVMEGLKVRVAGAYSDEDGYFYNLAQALTSTGAVAPKDSRIGPNRRWTVRATVLWEPTNSFSARLKVSLNHDKEFYAGQVQMVSCPDGVTAPSGVPFIGGGEDCRLDRTYRSVAMSPLAFPAMQADGVPFIENTQKYGSLELNWRPRPDITLTSVTGYYWLRTNNLSNGTNSTFAAPAFVAAGQFRRYDWTEEVRANTDFSGPFNFTAGFFYQTGDFSQNGPLPGNVFYRLPAQIFRFLSDVDVKSISPFGQIRWKPIAQLEIAGGARYTDEKRSETAANVLPNGVIVPVRLGVPKIHSKKWQPELTITYKPTDDVTVFGSLKKGYKSGSFNYGVVPFDGIDSSYGDETVKGGELGLKSRWFDRTVTFETAYFDYRYSGLQVGTIEPTQGGLPQTRTVNAGSARTYGVEFSSTWRPPQVQGLDLFLNGQWNRARFKRLTNVPCWGGQTIAEGCSLQFSQAQNNGLGGFTAQNLNGIPLPRAPEWQVNFGFDYEMALADGKTLTFTNNNSYYSRYLIILGTRPDFYQPSFFKTDAGVALHGADDRWELALIGKNLTNKITLGSCSSSNFANGAFFGGQVTGGTVRGPAGVDEVGCRTDRGRELWLRVTYRPMG
jgi:iron complex outermembrane receptor protein